MATKKKIIAQSPIASILNYAMQDKQNINSQANCPTQIKISFKISEEELVELAVKTTLSPKEMINFVSNISTNLFTGEEYHPENYNIVFAWLALEYYAGIKANTLDIVQISQLVYQTEIINTLLSKVNQKQLLDIKNAIKTVVDFRQQSILSLQQAALDRITLQLTACADLIEKMAVKAEGIDLNKLSDTVITLFEKDKEKLSQGISESNEINK